MNLKNQPTAMMPDDLMYDVERDWGMSKAAWMDVAWDLVQEAAGTDNADVILERLRERANLILMYRKQAKAK